MMRTKLTSRATYLARSGSYATNRKTSLIIASGFPVLVVLLPPQRASAFTPDVSSDSALIGKSDPCEIRTGTRHRREVEYYLRGESICAFAFASMRLMLGQGEEGK